MEKEIRDLYERIKGRNVESLRQTLETGLMRRKKSHSNENMEYNYKIIRCDFMIVVKFDLFKES